jgi:hypothetical protein
MSSEFSRHRNDSFQPKHHLTTSPSNILVCPDVKDNEKDNIEYRARNLQY